MILYRMTDGRLLARRPDDQFFTDEHSRRYYTDQQGTPVDAAGVPVPGQVVTKFVHTFEEYVALYPEAQKYWRWLCDDRKKGVRLVVVQTYPGHGCMPGNMVNVACYPVFKHPVNPRWNTPPNVLVNDGDDGYVRKTFATEEEADKGFAELLEMAPFYMGELTAFGYVLE